jgi:hypothetical protein
LRFDRGGYWLIARRLEQGAFAWPCERGDARVSKYSRRVWYERARLRPPREPHRVGAFHVSEAKSEAALKRSRAASEKLATRDQLEAAGPRAFTHPYQGAKVMR